MNVCKLRFLLFVTALATAIPVVAAAADAVIDPAAAEQNVKAAGGEEGAAQAAPDGDAGDAAAPEGEAEAEPEEPKEDPLVAEGNQLMARVQELRGEIAELREKREKATGEDLQILEAQIVQRQLEGLEDVKLIVANVLAQEKKELDASALRKEAEELIAGLGPAIRKVIEETKASVDEQAKQRDSTEPAKLITLEEALAKRGAQLDGYYAAAVENRHEREQLGLPPDDSEEPFSTNLQSRARETAGRIELTVDQLGSAEQRLADAPDDAAHKDEVKALNIKLDAATASLNTQVKLLQELDLDAAEYQQLLIRATGQLTTDIFQKEVALGLVDQAMQRLRKWIQQNGPPLAFKVLFFAILLAAFWLLSSIVRRVVKRSVSTSRLQISQLLQHTFTSWAANSVMILGLLVALSQLGLELAPVLTGLGVAGFIVGFALQDTLANFAAGVMILMYRPYDVGDVIEAGGVFGTASSMSLVSTTILTFDNQTLVVPNSKIWGDVIKNVTAQRLRRVDLEFGISYTDDIPKTEAILAEIVASHESVLASPEPVVRLHELGDSSVNFIVRPWVKTADYWTVHWDITREVKMRFDREGISIPFPQRDVHVYRDALDSAA